MLTILTVGFLFTSPLPETPGFSFDLVYTGETMGAVSGGREQKHSYLDNLDLVLNYDGENTGHAGWTASLYLLYNSGFDPSDYIGDVQTASNIQAPDTTTVFEAWIQREKGGHALLIGLFDFNSEFDVIESAGSFLNSSHGIGPDYSQAGLNGPSIFPTSSLTLRYAYLWADGWLTRAAVADGVPGHPEHPKGTRIHLGGDDGWLTALEVSRTGAQAAWKITAGLWHQSGDFEYVDQARGGLQTGNSGIYLSGEKDFGAWQAFARLGVADKDVNTFGDYGGLGVVLPRFLGRDGDHLGFAMARAREADSGQAETNFECTWHIQIGQSLTLQPDLQYILNPGFGFEDALVLGLRFAITIF